MQKSDDLGEEHLSWLVENRSRNQRATLELYLLIKENAELINSKLIFGSVAQELVGIAFSLWRAVFLSDLTDAVEAGVSDAEKFLATLISHNAIAYPQDRTAREWSFPYYLTNARLRLIEMASRPPILVELADIEVKASSAKEDWVIAQAALEIAIRRFGELLKEA